MRLAWEQVESRGSLTKSFEARNASDSKPLSITPSGYWNGNDGPWSGFSLGFGSNKQFLNVLISTSSNAPWTVVPEGCSGSASSDCAKARGGLFERNASSSWQDIGQYALGFEENLGFFGTGLYGYDTVSLGLPGSGAPILDHQAIAGIKDTDFWVATWGIRPAPLNFTTISDPVTSLVSTLKDNNDIPSLSWGYTAGSYAQYQDSKSGLASLTLGGFDASRFKPHDTKFTFGPDISRDLLVGIQSIVVEGGAITKTELLPDAVLSFIDAGTPHIWLPEAACDKFAQTFGLSYSKDMDLYLMNTTQYEQYKAQNFNLNFTLGSETSGGPTVTLSFPSSAFDLELTTDYPGIDNSTRYFPLRRAANETQYTLGRAFLQHAYVIADYENSEFSVHQARFPDSQQQDLQAIYPASNSTSGVSNKEIPHRLATGAVAGIVIAIIAILLVIGSGAFIYYRGRKKTANGRDKHPDAVEVPANEKPELASTLPVYKKVLVGMGVSVGGGASKGKFVNEMEQPPVELEVPKVNHEVAARERAVVDDRDSWGTEGDVWTRRSGKGDWGKGSGETQDLGVQHEVHELP